MRVKDAGSCMNVPGVCRQKIFQPPNAGERGGEVGISAKSLVGWCFETWWLAKTTSLNLPSAPFLLCAPRPPWPCRLPSQCRSRTEIGLRQGVQAGLLLDSCPGVGKNRYAKCSQQLGYFSTHSEAARLDLGSSYTRRYWLCREEI